MSEHEEKKVETPKEVAKEETEKKVEKLTVEEELKQLKVRNTALEKVAVKLKGQILHTVNVGRPIHLTLTHNSFIYQFIIPELALQHIDQFCDAHSILSKFGVILSGLELNDRKAIEKAQEEAEKKKAEATEEKTEEEKK